jgi:3-methyl-2-oxobutanoate hydroxymethyltransferase
MLSYIEKSGNNSALMTDKTKWTAAKIKALKGKQKITCLTAYDYTQARLVDDSEIELILVGDSLAMTVLGYEDTLPVTMDEMLHHTRAVVRGVTSALVVADMPFMSYQVSADQAVFNAGRFLKDAGAGAIKIEGGSERVPLVERLVANGIPVLGHIGLTPQSINETGGYKVQGKTTEAAEKLIADAKSLSEAGVFAIVLECVPEELGKAITEAVSVPTIGIGAGRGCDGQILVIHDLLGMFTGKSPKLAKRYAELGDAMKKAFGQYRSEVQDGTFPGEDNIY